MLKELLNKNSSVSGLYFQKFKINLNVYSKAKELV